ncbi:hypothetical protein JCM8097_008453 [Rhodosporidiobolus ruineniae]
MSDLNDGLSDDICKQRHSSSELGLRIGALWVILVTSLLGTLFPIVAKRVPALRRRTPATLFEFAKSAGSGVILATALIHLLEPAVDLLGDNDCISPGWAAYPYPYALVLVAIYISFVLQIFATRYGRAKLESFNGLGSSDTAVYAANSLKKLDEESDGGAETASIESRDRAFAFQDATEENTLGTQIVAICSLEFGICFHSVIIGLTLAVSDDDEFKPLFVVLVFHQMFEGLGVGARLAFLTLDQRYNWIPWACSILYSICTPVGMAVGLGIHQGLPVDGEALSVVSGVMYALSAGILLHTAMVELMAHEVIFSKYYHTCSIGRLSFTLGSFAVGAGLMAALAKWA